ncbi:MAG: biotin--[acetyl-CoA-carboxylase] ligase [Proteobacteria bacterium]|nr:biotin--[acetyl-CoA-carboxylase] ligase [Pseudomonadota bacterium]
MSQSLSVEVEWHESVSSTSAIVRERMNQGFDFPIAVGARVQTSGIGRQGSKWASLLGNLHLSIGLPPQSLSESYRPILSLWIGVLCREWIANNFGVAPCLKWPNDLVINACKVGGILCEATYSGGQFQGASIGIGLNIQDFPKNLNDYDATSLQRLTGRIFPPRAACDSLAKFIWSSIEANEMSVEQITERYRHCAVAIGHDWIDFDNHRGTVQSYSNEGYMMLQMDQGVPMQVTSAGQNWSLRLLNTKLFVVSDVGNSRAKFGLCTRVHDEINIVETCFYNINQSSNSDIQLRDSCLQRVNGWLTSGAESLMHCCSVNDQHDQDFLKFVTDIGFRTRAIQRTPLFNLQSAYDMNKIGMDRFCAIEAVLSLRSRGVFGGPTMIVSLGTASTLDFVSSDGQHLGGFIGIGVQSALRALNSHTSKLPLMSPPTSDRAHWNTIGESTETAIEASSIRMIASWIDREAIEFCGKNSVPLRDLSIVLSGGFSDLVQPLLSVSSEIRKISDLVMRGVAILAMNGR